MNDGAMYTGIDYINDGTFGNEKPNDEVTRIIEDQKTQLKELTPKLQDICDMIDRERQVTLEFIAAYVDNNKDDNELYRAELKAAGRYRQYLDTLKTKFSLALNESKGGL